MKKRMISAVLCAAILFSVIMTGAFRVSAASELTASDECIALLKSMEGFSRTPYWDYSQWTVGYGTKCPDEDLERYKQDGITEEEAEALLWTYVDQMSRSLNSFIDKYQLSMTQNQFDALLLFTYNCGNAWLLKTGVFRSAIIDGATGNEFLAAITLWCKAGSQVQTHLIRRRLIEANIYLNGVYSSAVPDNYCYVIYNAAGGSCDPVVQGYDSNLTAAPASVATYDGYDFDGWYTASGGGTKVTVLDASVRNRTLYAHWTAGSGDNPPAPSDEEGVTVTVTADNVNVRQGPGTNYAVVGSVSTGKQLVITETATGSGYTWGKFVDGWICLKYTNYSSVVDTTEPEEEPPEPQEPEVPETEPDEPEVPEQPAEPEEPEAPETPEEPEEPKTVMGTVKVSDALRIRSGPGTGYSVVGSLSNGARVEILEQKTVGSMVWGRISKGWISLSYVTLDPAEEEKDDSSDGGSDNSGDTGDSGDSGSSGTQTGTVLTGKVVNATQLRIRSGPGTSYSIVGYLSNGAKVEITEQKSSGSMMWGKISNGWISMDYVQLDTTPDTPAQVITGTVKVNDYLRVRNGPGTSYAVAGYLTNGTKVEILEQRTVGSTVWGRTSKGWISMDYVVVTSGSASENSGSAAPTTVTKTVTADCLRIRSNAGTGYSIVGYLYAGAKVEILETKTVNGMEWGRISKGWISMDYVK